MKILQVKDKYFHADRRTDITKLIDAFHNFAKAPTNVSNVPPAPKRSQCCFIQLAIALRLTDRKKVCLYFPFLFPRPTTHPTHVKLLNKFKVCANKNMADIRGEAFNLDYRTEFYANRCSSPKDRRPSAPTP